MHSEGLGWQLGGIWGPIMKKRWRERGLVRENFRVKVVSIFIQSEEIAILTIEKISGLIN